VAARARLHNPLAQPLLMNLIWRTANRLQNLGERTRQTSSPARRHRGLTLGLTWAPRYASLCSEDFYAYDTHLHVISFYALLASTGCALLLRAYGPVCYSISKYYLTRRQVPVLRTRFSVSGQAFALWSIGITLATTGFWIGPLLDFWALRTTLLRWGMRRSA